MEKTLCEMLQDLQCFMYTSIDLCKTIGNGLGDVHWRITYIQTQGGEMFRFTQPDYLGREGSGIYFKTVEEAENYAQECIRTFFRRYDKIKLLNFDPNDFDWHPKGRLADI